MFKKIVLCFVFAAGLFLSASCGNVKLDDDRMPLKGINLVIIFGNRANTKALSNDNEYIKDQILRSFYYTEKAFEAKANIGCVISEGTPRKVSMGDLTVKGKRNTACNNKINDKVKSIMGSLANGKNYRAKTEEADLIKALDEAAGIFNDFNNGRKNVLLIIDSGITTTGALDMNENDIGEREENPANIVNAIEKEGLLPDMKSLNIEEIIFVGLGKISAVQDNDHPIPDDKYFRDNWLKALWEQILVRSTGISKDKIEWRSANYGKENSDKDFPHVEQVKFRIGPPLARQTTYPIDHPPPPPPGESWVISVTVFPPNYTIGSGGEQQFTAAVETRGYATEAVTWSIESAGGLLAGTKISEDGMLSVDSGETASELTVRATSTFPTHISGTATVTIMQPVEPDTTEDFKTGELIHDQNGGNGSGDDDPGNKEEPPTFPEKSFFVINSCKFDDEATVDEVLSGYIDSIKKYLEGSPDNILYIVGSQADDRQPTNELLSLCRADRVREKLIQLMLAEYKEFDVPVKRLVSVKGGRTVLTWRNADEFGCPYIPGTIEDGNIHKGKGTFCAACGTPNRVVVLVAHGSIEYRELEKNGLLNQEHPGGDCSHGKTPLYYD